MFSKLQPEMIAVFSAIQTSFHFITFTFNETVQDDEQQISLIQLLLTMATALPVKRYIYCSCSAACKKRYSLVG
jgi:hypothetical protein